jgi:hypothetical protein
MESKMFMVLPGTVLWYQTCKSDDTTDKSSNVMTLDKKTDILVKFLGCMNPAEPA